MGLLDFRIRSEDRDRQTDLRRFDRLRKLADDLADEVERERDGLEKRYRKAEVDAAFSFEELENSVDMAESGRVDALTRILINTQSRLAALRVQSDFLRRVARGCDDCRLGERS